MWVAAYGPKALALTGEVGDGFILQLADLSIAEWTIGAVRAAAAAAGRNPDDITICVAAPAYVTDGTPEGLAHGREQCRWFGGMVGNHVADIVARYGADDPSIPQALTDYIKGRQGYDYNEHGQAGNTHTAFVPDEIVDRFCIVGPPEVHIERMQQLKDLGVDQFSIYLQHDDKDDTLPGLRREGACRQWPSTSGPPDDHGHRSGAHYARPGTQDRRCSSSRSCSSPSCGRSTRRSGPRTAATSLGMRVLPRTSDLAMPHMWDMFSRLTRARGAWQPRLGSQGGRCSPPGTRSACALTAFVIGTLLGIGLAVADGPVPGGRACASCPTW